MIRRLLLAAIAVFGLQTAYADGPNGVPAGQLKAGGKAIASGNAVAELGGGDGDFIATSGDGGRQTTLNSGPAQAAIAHQGHRLAAGGP
jgi:flagellar P-ring protein precursor FlgI